VFILALVLVLATQVSQAMRRKRRLRA
jgi:hypothetical protein